MYGYKQRLKNLLNNSIVEKDSYFPFIDGLRGLAILLIVLIHTAHSPLTGYTGPNSVNPIYETFVDFGARGVQLFFILSAFTLFSSSLRRYRVDKKPVFSFYVRRIFRIIPFWWIMCIFYGLFYDVSFAQVVIAATFLFGFFRFDSNLELIEGGWSLFVEETFYLLLPILFSKIKSIRQALLLLISMLILGDMWMWFSYHYPVLQQNSFAYLFPFNQWFAFAFGIVAFYIIANKKFTNKIFSSKYITWSIDLTVLTFIMLSTIADFRIETAALFSLTIVSSSQVSIIGKLMRTKLIMHFGKYCYSIYLLHFVVLDKIRYASDSIFSSIGLENATIETKGLVMYIIVACICLVVGFVSYNIIEKKFVELGKKFINKINLQNAR